METQVKERIVGAAILVALGVWLIPWVLDGTGESTEESQVSPGLTLPSADDSAPVRTETVELEPSDSPRNPVADSTSTEPAAVAVLMPQSVAVATGASDDRSASAEETTPTALPEPLPDLDGWTVQLGAFGEIANANQLATRAAAYGFSAVVSEFRAGGDAMHRVRVGGFDSEDEAQAAASSLSAHGFPVRVIPPE